MVLPFRGSEWNLIRGALTLPSMQSNCDARLVSGTLEPGTFEPRTFEPHLAHYRTPEP